MTETKMFGTIKWFNNERGEGYILGADNESYFFNLLTCIRTDYVFNEGEEVLFIPNFIDLTATSVEKSEANELN